MSNLSSNYNDPNNLSFINCKQYLALNEYMKVLCSDRGISAYISNAISNIENCTDDLLRKILSEICPEKITDVLNLFNISHDEKLFKYLDLIFNCSSCKIISKIELSNMNIYKFDEWLSSDLQLYTYYNYNVSTHSRVVANNKKNVMTLKIQNEELKEDISSINIMLKFNDAHKINYVLHVKAYVVNDSHGTIKNTPIFRQYFNAIDQNEQLYNKLHLRDCCLNSFNGMNPMAHIKKIYNMIATCNSGCSGQESESESINIDEIGTLCNDTTHYIQKFARNCFHIKYLIIIHTVTSNINACIYLAVILVRCNSKMCREFLDCLPSSIKFTVMSQSGIGASDESKMETVLSEKINLTQKMNIWKQLFNQKYGLNVKKIINRCNELSIEENKEERLKKMIGYFEKISTRIYFLKIHNELIEVVDLAKSIHVNATDIFSIHGVMKLMCNKQNLFESTLGKAVKKYLANFATFEKNVREQIMKLSEGQLAVKKAIYQYIINIVSNTNIFSTKKTLCLIGPPGVGKTYIAIAIARILFFEPEDNPTDDDVKELVYILSVPSITSELRLTGSESVYVGAGPGILAKELYFVEELCKKLIVFDEIDKSCKYIDQLLPILDYTQNSKIVDNYLDIEMDMKTGIQVATANDEHKINPILCQRMDIIHLNGYSVYTKCRMIQNQLLKTLLKEKGLSENLLFITENVLENLIIHYTKEAGVRKLKNLIIDIISVVNLAIVTTMTTKLINNVEQNLNLNLNLNLNTISISSVKELYDSIGDRYINYIYNNVPITITHNDLDIMLADKHKIKNDKITDILHWTSGNIIGLYATSLGIGGILPIAIKFNKSLHKKGLVITTGALDVMKDSAQISTILTSDYLCNEQNEDFSLFFGIEQSDFSLRCAEILNNAAIHVILDSSVQKDGPSAGGAFMIAYISHILGHTLSKHVGITGEINSNFIITQIGGINMKINGAMLAGCRSVIVPVQNIDDVIKELVYDSSIDCKNSYGKRVAFIYYSDKEQSYILLIRTKPTNDVDPILQSFDVNIVESSKYYDNYDNDVPCLYRIKLNLTSLIDPNIGLDIILFGDVGLSDLLRDHFVIIAEEKIPQIYYFMIMAKQIYEYDMDIIHANIDKITQIHYDGIELKEKLHS